MSRETESHSPKGAKSKSAFSKQLLVAIVSCAGVLLLLAGVLPQVVDVDRFRPALIEEANARLNGSMELGRLHLSLWGRFRVDADGIKLADGQGRPVVAAAHAEIQAPLLSLLSGKPVLTLRIASPSVAVIRDGDGRLNLLGLFKSPSRGLRLPGILARSRLGIEVEDASFSYSDERVGARTQLTDFDLSAHDVSLEGTTRLVLRSQLDFRPASGGRVNGPFEFRADVTPTLGAPGSSVPVSAVRGRLAGDFTGLAVSIPPRFEKKPGMRAMIEGDIDASPDSISLHHLVARFLNAEVDGEGKITRLNILPPAPGAESVSSVPPVLDLALRSNDVGLEPWAQVFPSLAEWKPGGRASFSVRTQGALDRLNFTGEVEANDLTTQHPLFKAVPVVDGTIRFSTDSIDSFDVRGRAPGNDLHIQGSVASLTTAPRGSFTVASSGLDLDQLIWWEEPASSSVSTQSGSSQGRLSVQAEDRDAALDALRGQPLARSSRISVTGMLPFVQARQTRIDGVEFAANLRDLVLSVDRLNGRIWSGQVKASGAADLKPAVPAYRYFLDVNGMNVGQAAESRLHLFENTVLGTASFHLRGTGASFNPESALRNAGAKGAFLVQDAVFTTLDIGRAAADAVNGAIDRIARRIPALKGRKFGAALARAGARGIRYESIGSDLVLSRGQVALPHLSAVSAKGAGLDLKGSLGFSLEGDHPISARLEITDTWDLLQVRGLGVELAGRRIDNLLADGNGPVRFPVTVRGTAASPKVSTLEVPEFLASIAIGKVTGVASRSLREEAEKLLKQAPKDVQSAINDLPNLLKKKK